MTRYPAAGVLNMEEALGAPVAPVVEQSEVSPAAEAPRQDITADPVEESRPGVKPERTFTQKELDEILQKRLAKESRKIERYSRAEAELRLLKEQMQPRQEQPVNRGEPKPDQFQDYESYIEAVTDWKVEQKFKGIKAQTEQERQRHAQSQHEAKIRENLTKAADKYDDFEEVISSPDLIVTIPMRDAIGESDMGGDIAYYLGTNKQEAAQIAKLSPIGQVKAILALETKLKAPKKVTTDAPEPINPSGGTAKVSKSPAEMTDAEFDTWRRKHIKARG